MVYPLLLISNRKKQTKKKRDLTTDLICFIKFQRIVKLVHQDSLPPIYRSGPKCPDRKKFGCTELDVNKFNSDGSIYNENRNGPRIDPWGTPLYNGKDVDQNYQKKTC